MRPESKRRCEQLPRLLVEVNFERTRVRLAVVPVEYRFGVEQVHLAGTAVLKQTDHRLGSRPRLDAWLRARRTRRHT